jgi:CRISPR-associated protein Csx14
MPEYRIPVNPSNPGQYFACCGLFELAELAAPGGEALFEGGSVFALNTDALMPPQRFELLPHLGDERYEVTLEPLDFSFFGRVLKLNWWLNETLTGKSRLKTWGGQQRPRTVLAELLRLLDYSTPCEALFDAAVYTTSRFGVDARSAWDALDAGYSPNDVGQQSTTFPWVEVLAVVGLQGFRPAEQQRARYRYATWGSPLPLVAARAASAAPWPGLRVCLFEFPIAGRGQGYKTFLFAEGANDV